MVLETFAGLEKFENGCLATIVRLPFDKMEFKSTVDFTDFEATKNYCEEMKETLSNMSGCSCS